MRPIISLRRAVANDAVETALLFSAALKSMSFFPKLHSDDEDHHFVASFIENSETWLATDGNQILGLASIRNEWLDHLYVDPAFHNGGAGSTLLRKVKERRPGGFRLWAFQANTGARRFYERHGCRVVRFTDGSRNEEKLPDVLYVWGGRAPALRSPGGGSNAVSGEGGK